MMVNSRTPKLNLPEPNFITRFSDTFTMMIQFVCVVRKEDILPSVECFYT